jgi:hypothetical protein
MPCGNVLFRIALQFTGCPPGQYCCGHADEYRYHRGPFPNQLVGPRLQTGVENPLKRRCVHQIACDRTVQDDPEMAGSDTPLHPALFRCGRMQRAVIVNQLEPQRVALRRGLGRSHRRFSKPTRPRYQHGHPTLIIAVLGTQDGHQVALFELQRDQDVAGRRGGEE